MAACVRGSTAYPAARSCCGIDGSSCVFELKEYKNSSFTCSVCMMDSFDTERYRCNGCNKTRHKGCIQLPEKILIGPGPNNIFGCGVHFTRCNQPQRGFDSANKRWATYCMVCGMVVKQYSYHVKTSKKVDLNMHPCCAELVRSGGNHPPHELTLEEKPHCVYCTNKLPPGASPHGPKDFFCWSYILPNNIRVHVNCYTEMVIKALKSIELSHPDNDGNVRIVLKRRNDGRNYWRNLDKALEIGLSLAGVDTTTLLINWIFS